MSGLSGLIEHFPYLGIFILLILGGIGLPLPEDTTLILCGFLVSNDMLFKYFRTDEVRHICKNSLISLRS